VDYFRSERDDDGGGCRQLKSKTVGSAAGGGVVMDKPAMNE